MKLTYWENDRIRHAFRQYGPERDRDADWQKCQEEPWRTFSDVVNNRVGEPIPAKARR